MTLHTEIAPSPVKSADRALELLEILGDAGEPLSVAELHRRTGYPRSSLHGLLHTMLARGWITAEDGGRVGVGARALVAGTGYLERDAAVAHARTTLDVLRGETGYTTHYARLVGSDVVYLDSREAADAHRAISRIGRRLPAHATALGKALLAELSTEELRALYPDEPLQPLTVHTVATVSELLRECEECRTTGAALEFEQNTIGTVCVSAAVPYRIPATDAISCSIPLAAASAHEIERVRAAVLDAAARLAAVLRREGIR